MTAQCDYCGRTFDRKEKSAARYCSKECRAGARFNLFCLTPDTHEYLIIACPNEGWRHDMSYNFHLYGYDIFVSSGYRPGHDEHVQAESPVTNSYVTVTRTPTAAIEEASS